MSDQDTAQAFDPVVLSSDQWIRVEGCAALKNLIGALWDAHRVAHQLEQTSCSDGGEVDWYGGEVDWCSVWVGEVDGRLHVAASVAVEGAR